MKSLFNRAVVLSTLVLGALTLSPVASAATPHKANFDGCTPDRTIFFSYTEKGSKAVELCDVDGNYRYTFGPINKPEIQLTQLPGEAGSVSEGMMVYFAVKNGNTIYRTTSKGPGRQTFLAVLQGETLYHSKTLAEIPLDEGSRFPYTYHLLDNTLIEFIYD